MRKLLLAGALFASMTTATHALEVEILKPVVFATINISTQKMHVSVGGKRRHTFTVSTGADGHRTPTGTFTPYRSHRHYYSRQYDNSPMHYALFFLRGYAIHATESLKYLGVPASYGCVRLHPSNAATFWKIVKKYGMGRTRIRVKGDWREAERRIHKHRKAAARRNVGKFANLSQFGD